MRTLTKSWKGKRNNDGSVVSVRHSGNMLAKWYDGSDDIRISLEDSEGRTNHYFSSEEEAEKLWKMFKEGKISHNNRCLNEQ